MTVSYQSVVNNKDLAIVVVPNRFMYLKVPKTAGTSIYRGLICKHIADKQIINSRINRDKFDHFIRNDLSRTFSFVFVRNPWDRTLSNYLYFKKIFHQDMTFRSFIEKIVTEHYDDSNNDDTLRRHVCKQSLFLFDDIDFVGRYENLSADWKIVSGQIGLPSTLPNMNRTKHEKYSKYYNSETRDMIGNYYRDEIEILKYRF